MCVEWCGKIVNLRSELFFVCSVFESHSLSHISRPSLLKMRGRGGKKSVMESEKTWLNVYQYRSVTMQREWRKSSRCDKISFYSWRERKKEERETRRNEKKQNCMEGTVMSYLSMALNIQWETMMMDGDGDGLGKKKEIVLKFLLFNLLHLFDVFSRERFKLTCMLTKSSLVKK